MGWADSESGKVNRMMGLGKRGHAREEKEGLSKEEIDPSKILNSEVPVLITPFPLEPPIPDARSPPAVPEMKRTRSDQELDAAEEFQGPDTSSLGAFLMSLLNYGPNQQQQQRAVQSSDDDVSTSGSSDYDSADDGDFEEDEAGPSPRERRHWEEEEERGSRKHGRRGVWERPRRWLLSRLGIKAESRGAPSVEQEDRGEKGNVAVAEAPGSRGASVEQLVLHKGRADRPPRLDKEQEELDAAGAAANSVPPDGELSPNETSGEISPPGQDGGEISHLGLAGGKLPGMSEESFLLSEQCRATICSALPAIANGREWVLLYSTIKHGISLLTLYRRSAHLPGPCLLVVSDPSGACFGGFSPGPLKPSNQRKYQGTSESFVFSDVSGAASLYRSTGSNRYFLLCMTDAVAFGGGGHFALRLEADLLSGSSGQCETFGNPCLAMAEDFSVKHVELWGFTHASRYTPRQSAWHEPTESHGFHAL